MSDPLASLREALASSPRDMDHLHFEQTGWNDSDRQAATDLLLEAANRGDRRVPSVLEMVCGDDADPLLNDLLTNAPDGGVRVHAALTLMDGLGTKMVGFFADLVAGKLSDLSITLVIRLWLQTGRESMVRAALTQTQVPQVRKSCAHALWEHHGLNMYSTVPWTGLGLVKAHLDVLIDSFQRHKLADFLDVIGLHPAMKGYAPCTDAISPALHLATDDLQRAAGAIDSVLVASLNPEERESLAVSAAQAALKANPLGVRYVAYLDGATHRDLLEWAAGHPDPDVVEAGRESLQGLDSD